MKNKQFKSLVLLFGLMLPTAWCIAKGSNTKDGYGNILVKESVVQNTPRGHTIQASIDGHTLTVMFTENIGQVAIEVFKVTGGAVETFWIQTPDGLQTYIPLAGDYVITFTLSNGDEYYGEFTVTD